MRVLLCTPYEQNPKIVSGGINIWGKSIVDYYHSIHSAVLVDFVSYDRKYDVKENSPFFFRIYYGVKDYLKAILQTKDCLRKNKYELLHLCSSAQLGLIKDMIVLWLAHRFNTRAVIHFHFGRIPELIRKKTWESRLLQRVCHMSDSIIVMDSESYKCLQLWDQSKVFFLPNPLSESVVDAIKERELKIARKDNKVLYAGHVIESKGVYELVKACLLIDGIELHIVGTVSQDIKDNLERMAKSKNNGAWLVFRGRLSRLEVITEMLSSTVFVLPSYTEGFPNVVLESMACGCPIIATPVGAIPEILAFDESHPCGLKIKVKDILSIREGLLSLLVDKRGTQEMSLRAKKRVQELYLMPSIWSQLERVWIKTARLTE